jgi:hypothetical protein
MQPVQSSDMWVQTVYNPTFHPGHMSFFFFFNLTCFSGNDCENNPWFVGHTGGDNEEAESKNLLDADQADDDVRSVDMLEDGVIVCESNIHTHQKKINMGLDLFENPHLVWESENIPE